MDRLCAPRLSLDLLRGFRAAARQLSFTRAAQELFVTQGAISREVRTLEEQLGRPLFRRVNRALQLTEAGQDLFAAVDQALALIDAAATRVASTSRTLSVTTTVALASTWLVPRLPSFAQRHPEVDMRLVASNDALDLERENLDLAIRFVPLGMAPPSDEKLFDYLQFPVCAPALAADPARPLRESEHLAQHVLLDFETVLYGRPWYDWSQWFGAQGLRGLKGAGWLRFSHYDQVIEAALKGSGVAVGKLPHLAQHLRDGRLVAPLGEHGVARLGAFYIERTGTASTAEAQAFLGWLREEVERDARHEPAAVAHSPAPDAGNAASSHASAAPIAQNAPSGPPRHRRTTRRTLP
jgi:DNA-binding transcriptional LysR family regulator